MCIIFGELSKNEFCKLWVCFFFQNINPDELDIFLTHGDKKKRQRHSSIGSTARQVQSSVKLYNFMITLINILSKCEISTKRTYCILYWTLLICIVKSFMNYFFSLICVPHFYSYSQYLVYHSVCGQKRKIFRNCCENQLLNFKFAANNISHINKLPDKD